MKILISKTRSCRSHTASEVTQHHFCCFPLLETKHMVNPDPKGAEIDWISEGQDYAAKEHVEKGGGGLLMPSLETI